MKHINYRRMILFIMLFVGALFLVGYELCYVLYSPKPDFKVTVGLLDEINDADVIELGNPITSTISLKLTCETPNSFIPGSSIQIAVFVDGAKVEVITSSTIYPKKEGRGPVGSIQFIVLPKQFLVDGEHTMIIKSYQRRGRLFFISGTVREKHDEYKMIVSDGSITALLDCPCPVSVRSLENEDSEAETGLKSQEDSNSVEAKSE